MAKENIIFQSEEEIFGLHPKARESAIFNGILKVKTTGKKPISLELSLSFNPFMFEMPEKYSIKAESVTEIYIKLNRFLKQYDLILK